MAQNQPVIVGEIINLPSLGVNGEYIKFGTTSMESDKFITICEQVNGQSNVVIIDLTQGNSVTKRPISAEAAIMNPVSKVIALRAGSQLQIFNMELRAKMKSYQITDAVVFWRWISPNMIGLVTATSVYHWSIEGDSPPSKLFDRNPSIGAGNQIINYEVSDDGNWCLLVGIAQGEGGTIVGNMQLYSKEKQVSQVLQGHAGAFTTIKPPGRTDDGQILCFAGSKAGGPAQLFIMEVGRDKDAPGGVFRLAPQAIPFPPEAQNDFPVSVTISPNEALIYMITKMGFLFIFDVYTGKPLYRTRISQDTIFVTTYHSGSKGVLGISRRGQVLQMSINKAALAPYIVNTLRDSALAISLAGRLDLPGVDELYMTEFNRLLSIQDIPGAATLAATSPQGILRTPATIMRFQQLPAIPNQPQPILQYFSILLEKNMLNKHESIELARPVLQQGRSNLLEKWLVENKLECSEELGDMISGIDINMALSVYLRANIPEKVINCFVQRGEFDKIVAYATKSNYRCDYSFILQNLIRTNPAGALDFATKLATANSTTNEPPLIDVNSVVEIFMQVNKVQETTAFLLEFLKNRNNKEDGPLQTKLLEINLLGGSPQVADAILSNNMFSFYDRHKVAQLCEKCTLYQRALEHYTEYDDIKRVIVNTSLINHDFLILYFGNLTTEVSLKLINVLLAHNLRQNLNIVVQIATKYYEQLGGPSVLIELFEKYKGFEGLYYFLGGIVNVSTDKDVHFKYIEAATKLNQFKEVERVCRDSSVYDPLKVKDFLKEMKLQDPRPLIHVCDRFEFIEELTNYLYSNNLLKYIEVYATKVSPQKSPKVIGKLLDLDCNEDYIKNLINNIPSCPVDLLVIEVEKRNRLRLLQNWLETIINNYNNTDVATHNAIGKIYITLNKEPVNFLNSNQYYDSHVIGQFCEKLDPTLAFLAYRRAGGACDADLIRVTTENGLFKDQARYLVERQDLDLWASVLNNSNKDNPSNNNNMRALIDQVVQTALPESKSPEEVSTTVRAFMNADLPNELIELLERIVLTSNNKNNDFSSNSNLQNLLILTAIKADKKKVMDYINRLDNYDGVDIAKIAISDEYKLYEEAFTILKKTGKNNVEAIDILINKIQDKERAYEFADRCNEGEVWSTYATSQLNNNNDDGFKEAINSYIKAEDASNYPNVIEKGEALGKFEELIDYLKMARKTIKESLLDTSLIYCYAKSHKFNELEDFISIPNIGQIQHLGEKCFSEGLYDAAKILFRNINNNSKLAICYVKLGSFRDAVEAATKANAVSTWKEVCYACVAVNEFRLGALCGLHIIVHPDHLEEFILHYEKRGYIEELIKLMEQGLGLENVHTGIFTELGILYSKYDDSNKLMEHIKIFHSRMNISKLLRACEKGLHYTQMVYLYKQDNQYDNAVRTICDHPITFQHDLFLECIQKVRNQEIHYKAINFYLEQHPLDLTKLLNILTPNLDHARVVHQLRKKDNLPLIIEYLKNIQKENLSAVNEAINEIYIEDENYIALKESIDLYDNFDQISLAQKCEKHELLEFRRIAASLYKKNKRFQQAVNLSKNDKMYKDTIDTVKYSKDTELAENILKFFVTEVKDKECFAAMLYTCYELISPDVAIELAWRYNYIDFVMPFIIQYIKNTNDKIKYLQDKVMIKEQTDHSNTTSNPTPSGNLGLEPPFGSMMAIAATAYNNTGMDGMGQHQQYNTGMNSMGGMTGYGGMHQGQTFNAYGTGYQY